MYGEVENVDMSQSDRSCVVVFKDEASAARAKDALHLQYNEVFQRKVFILYAVQNTQVRKAVSMR